MYVIFLEKPNDIIKCLFYRRMKYEVLNQLPAKMRQIVVLDPSSVKISKQLKATEKAFVASKGKVSLILISLLF